MNPQQPYYGQAAPQGDPYYQGSPAPGQPQQSHFNYAAPPGQPQAGQFPNQPYPGGTTPNQSQHPGQYHHQPYAPQPLQVQYGLTYGQQLLPQSGPSYGQQPPPHPQGQYQQQMPYPPQEYKAPPFAQQWEQQPPQGMQPYGYNVLPTPASLGYDPAQKAGVQHVDTSADIEAIRKAMKGMGCDERTLIRVFTIPKYANPWAMAQLVRDYNSRFLRDLAKDIESETRGNLETVLLALVRGPLENDVYLLEKALSRAGTDEDTLMDVLLCRSNADLRAITAEYRRIRGRELLADIKDDVDHTLFRLYSMVLAATRAEDAAPVVAADIDQQVMELQRATEGTIGANAISVAQIFSSCNDSQIHALSDAYQRKYHRSLQDVIEKEFRGDMEDVLLRMLLSAMDRARSDAGRLREPLTKTVRKDRLLINRVVSLYRDRDRLNAAKAAYKTRYGRTFANDLKEILSGDYEDIMLALIGER